MTIWGPMATVVQQKKGCLVLWALTQASATKLPVVLGVPKAAFTFQDRDRRPGVVIATKVSDLIWA